jgi:ketosteroid isomerase-like protein
MDRSAVETWLADYERLWRTPGTDRLGELFADDASYSPSPWAPPVRGLDALARFWDAERVSAEEQFDLRTEVLAVDGGTAVVRVEVDYLTAGNRWRDLWIVELASDGRCTAFEEWPFAPDQPDGHDR